MRQEKQSQVFYLGSVFKLPGLAADEKKDMLFEQIKISCDEAGRFPQLLQEGYVA